MEINKILALLDEKEILVESSTKNNRLSMAEQIAFRHVAQKETNKYTGEFQKHIDDVMESRKSDYLKKKAEINEYASSIAKKVTKKDKSAYAMNESDAYPWWEQLKDIASDIVQNSGSRVNAYSIALWNKLTFGFGPEIDAFVTSNMQGMPYSQAKQLVQAAYQKARQENPTASSIGDLTGDIESILAYDVPMLKGAAASVKGIPAAIRAAKGVKGTAAAIAKKSIMPALAGASAYSSASDLSNDAATLKQQLSGNSTQQSTPDTSNSPDSSSSSSSTSPAALTTPQSQSTSSDNTNSDNTEYTIQSGDNLTRLAKKFNTSINALMSANPQIKNPNLIYAGDQLTIPTSTNSAVSEDLSHILRLANISPK